MGNNILINKDVILVGISRLIKWMVHNIHIGMTRETWEEILDGFFCFEF